MLEASLSSQLVLVLVLDSIQASSGICSVWSELFPVSVPIWLFSNWKRVVLLLCNDVCNDVFDTNQCGIGGIAVIELAYHHHLIVWFAEMFYPEGRIVKDMPFARSLILLKLS
jgi:hypothetical protein